MNIYKTHSNVSQITLLAKEKIVSILEPVTSNFVCCFINNNNSNYEKNGGKTSFQSETIFVLF